MNILLHIYMNIYIHCCYTLYTFASCLLYFAIHPHTFCLLRACPQRLGHPLAEDDGHSQSLVASSTIAQKEQATQ